MKNILFLFIMVIALSACQSKSGQLVEKPFTSEELNEDLVGNAPQYLSLDQMKAYKAAGMARLCDDWNTSVVQLYTAEDSAVYQWDNVKARYMFITFKL